MADNPYAAPNADVGNVFGHPGPILVYSPTQVACGTIGGPVGLIYFLYANFAALENDRLARQTLLWGGALILAIIASAPILPDEFPSSVFTFGYIIAARYLASTHQMTKQAITDSPDHDFHSNWRVLGLGLVCLVASAIVLLGPLMLLVYFGVWNP